MIAGDQIGSAYSSVLLIIDLYVMTIVSLSWPQEEPARDFRMFSFVLALLIVLFRWCENVYMVSNITPSSLGVLSRLTPLFSMLILGCIWASLVSGVKRVTINGQVEEEPVRGATTSRQHCCKVFHNSPPRRRKKTTVNIW